MTIPNYLHDGLINKTVSFSYASSGSYSIGYKMEFLKDKPDNFKDMLFLKIIPLCDKDTDDNRFLQFNVFKKISTSTEDMFYREINVQNYIYNLQRHNMNMNIPIYDCFILDSQRTFSDSMSNLHYFFKSLSLMEITNILDENSIFNCFENYKDDMKVGIIIMPYLDCVNGYKFFNMYTTPSKIFGSFFDMNELIIEIKKREITSNSLFMFVQIIYRLVELFTLRCIHDDLHMGNIMINKDEIITKQAVNKDGTINPIFVGRVYIIDYGNVNIGNGFDRELEKFAIRKKKSFPNFEFDASKFSHIIEMLGRKIVYDGYNRETKQITMEWYLYDWYFNLFFDKDLHLNKEIVKIMASFVKDFEKEIINYDKNESFIVQHTPISKQSNCCLSFF
tara:strand:- start:4560 stop:5735 length:1176 start_codon:yes stop_codon:yes gene_type:complete